MDFPATTATPIRPLPPEIWKIILEDVMRADIHNENNNDSSNSRLVCRQWESLIDGSDLKPLLPTWNPYFNTHVYAEGTTGFATTAGTHFSTGSEVEAFLSQWETEDPAPNPFLKETLLVEWKTNEDYTHVLEKLPAVFEGFGSYIHHLKMYFDPSVPKSLECMILCYKQLANLRSISIFVLTPCYRVDPNAILKVQPGALQKLKEVNLMGVEMPYEAHDELMEMFGTARGGENVKTLRAWAIRGRLLETSILTHFPNVNTLKICLDTRTCFADIPLQDGNYSAPQASSHIRDETENILITRGLKIRRLSVKLIREDRLRTFYLHHIFLLASALHETLEEFYVDFDNNRTCLEDVSIPDDVYRLLAESPFNLLTILCLPYFMTKHLPVLRRLTASCSHLEGLKLVHSEGYLQEGNEAQRKEEVREAVRRSWDHVPASVKWISVKFRKLDRDATGTNRRIMTNVVWRYERPPNWHME